MMAEDDDGYVDFEDGPVYCPARGSYCSDRREDLCADYGCWEIARRLCPPKKLKRIIRDRRDGTPDLFDPPLTST